MRPFISLLTAAAVALHLVLGCCAHHGHAGEGGDCTDHVHGPAVETVHHHCHSHGHDHGQPNSDSPATPWPAHGDCHESHCDFLMVGKTTFVPDVSLAVGSLAAIVPVAGQVVLSRPFSPRDRGDPFDLAVRPHLLHQVFLN